MTVVQNGHANGSAPSRQDHNKAVLAPFPNRNANTYDDGYLPAQPYPIGQLLPADKFPQNANPPKVFEPVTIRGVTFPHRLWVAPMCQYSSQDGHAGDHHFVHIGSMATRGWQGITIEATAVVPEGRITPEDAGLWSDSQIGPLKRQVDFVHAHQGTIGIQLAHAGRKASTLAPWVERLAREDGWTGGAVATKENNGWADNVVGASEVSFDDKEYPLPQEASLEYTESLKQAFLDAVERCKVIGFDYIEIHMAHGYLFHNFLSPLSNHRTDQYGGNLENRLRLPVEIATAVRAAWDKPLFVRFSASDWLEEVEGPEKAHPGAKEEWGWWGLEQSTILSQKLKDAGIDLLDISSGGNDLRGKIAIGPSYQVPFAAHIKKNVPGILIGTVGLITDPIQANDIVENGEADVVLFARQVLRDIDFPLQAAETLGAAVSPLVQYERAWSRMVVKRDHLNAKAHQHGKSEVEGEDGTDHARKN